MALSDTITVPKVPAGLTNQALYEPHTFVLTSANPAAPFWAVALTALSTTHAAVLESLPGSGDGRPGRNAALIPIGASTLADSVIAKTQELYEGSL